jgi:tyrosyl-tRNA synthetase
MKDRLNELKRRGLIQDITDEVGINCLNDGVSSYVGCDPSAPSLHIGNLLQLLIPVHLSKEGIRPIILFGGATGHIGDPTGKSQERQLMTLEQIEYNVTSISRKVSEIYERLNLEVTFVDNFDWFKHMTVMDFLRDTGKHFTVNYMTAKESIKNRLQGAGISFTEFSYMLIQAYDFYHLYQQHNCRIQTGGSDQWGNITAGLELIRKKCQGEAYALSTPLIVDSQGKKFGKTENGAIWIDEKYLSPYKFHQFLFNTSDADVLNYIRYFTFSTSEEEAELKDSLEKSPEQRKAQYYLADSVCTFVHGKEETILAKKCAEALFGGSLSDLDDSKLEDIFEDAPSGEISASELSSLTFIDLFTKNGFIKSKGEARRLLEQGGLYINNERVSESSTIIATTSFSSKKLLVLRSGKKNYFMVKIVA